MTSEMNKQVCLVCGVEATEKDIRCWNAVDTVSHIPDHIGVCCECFDVSQGAPPRVRLGEPTRLSLHDGSEGYE